MEYAGPALYFFSLSPVAHITAHGANNTNRRQYVLPWPFEFWYVRRSPFWITRALMVQRLLYGLRPSIGVVRVSAASAGEVLLKPCGSGCPLAGVPENADEDVRVGASVTGLSTLDAPHLAGVPASSFTAAAAASVTGPGSPICS